MSQHSDSDKLPTDKQRRRKPEPSPAQRALGLLVRREHSRKELALKLQARGISRNEARAAVEQMHEAGWQSDTRFAENLARNRAQQGHGPLRIRAELSAHGLPAEEIRNAFDAIDEDWQQIACHLVQRRYGSALQHDAAARRKAAEFLLRRGFTREQMQHALQHEGFDEFDETF